MPTSIEHRSDCTRDRPVHLRRASSGERDAQAQPPAQRRRPPSRPAQRLEAIELALHRWLLDHSLTILRISLGAVFLGFGFLKFFPGVSPAENLTATTTSILTLGLVPASVAMVAIASLECVIGLWLLSGRALRGLLVLLFIELVGILSPLVLLADRLFVGPHHAPTLEGQYVLKDVILVGAVLVLAVTVRGGRLTSPTRPWSRAAFGDRARRSTGEPERASSRG